MRLRLKSNNVEIMMGSETDEIIEELFKSLLERYQEGLEESVRESEFIFDSVDSLYYDLNKISLKVVSATFLLVYTVCRKESTC